MKVNKIILKDFKQYKGINAIDLSTTEEKNIILIGGKNGYGKTNFLLSLVWCLYGEDIVKIDENFKKEIQKDGNYYKFQKSCLNWSAAKDGIENYSVEIFIDNIELPDIYLSNRNSAKSCSLLRKFDFNSSKEEFEITIPGANDKLLLTADDKINFINDYIVPIEAAKFVFFDAEKIASWAELSTREEGNVLNDALGKILGLDIYEALKNDLYVYTDALRKENATAQVKQQIITTEKGIQSYIEKIDELDHEIISKETDIINIKEQVSKYEKFLSRFGNQNEFTTDIEEIHLKREKLINSEKDLENQFSEFCEIMPFIIAAGKFEEVIEHLQKQNKEKDEIERAAILDSKIDDILDKLFNQSPFPNDGDISFSKKIFYAEKARNVLDSVLGAPKYTEQVQFEHDISRSEEEFLLNTFNMLRAHSKDIMEHTINSYYNIQSEIEEIQVHIRKIEANQEDEEIIEYSNKKNEFERKLEKLIEEKGILINKRENLKHDIEKLTQSLHLLLKKIDVSEKKKKRLDKANQYIKAIDDFLFEQKKSKCLYLESAIYEEMRRLMHKLKDGVNQEFIAEVKVDILPDNDGLKVTLYNSDGYVVAKDALSQGEKQIYISSLVKALLSMSIQEFPIFIDTPLGRLDDDHIKQVLLNYYPDLAKQVVLMATNNEISPARYKLMKDNIAQTYLLDSRDNLTEFKPGYFKSHEN